MNRLRGIEFKIKAQFHLWIKIEGALEMIWKHQLRKILVMLCKMMKKLGHSKIEQVYPLMLQNKEIQYQNLNQFKLAAEKTEKVLNLKILK